jgi:hypothetical protein
MVCEWHDKIFSTDDAGFETLALEIFRYQYSNNRVYKAYVNALGVDTAAVSSVEEIPFLPVNFFKTHEIKTGGFDAALVFESSGTTQSINSRHHIKDKMLYVDSFTRSFEKNYGKANGWCIIGLLPSYIERNSSSLVFMVNELIKQSGHAQSGFYLNDFQKLADTIKLLEEKKQQTILLGVTFALLDFADKYPMPLHHTIIMETGGMKGRRKEMTSMEVHDILKRAFGKNEIHSEYGMTELLSQAYSMRDGIFQCPPWMRVLLREEDDPLAVVRHESIVNRESEFQLATHHPIGIGSRLTTHDSRLLTKTGAINIIDLANVHSCSFIATDDVGKLYADGSFEVLGRMDGSDLRGCSLMVV